MIPPGISYSSAAAHTYTTWNPADKNNITLSGANLIATSSGGAYPGGQAGVRSLISKSSGKWWWTVIAGSGIVDLVIGVANSTYVPTTCPGFDLNSWAYYGQSGVCLHNQVSTGSGFATYGVGDKIGLAYDAGAQTLQFYKNDVATGSLITGLSAAMFAAVGADQLTTSSTANFGASAFSFVPAGFNSGLYT